MCVSVVTRRLSGRTALALVLVAGLGLSGCKSNDVTGSIGATRSATQIERDLKRLERAAKKNPDDNAAVIAYSRALAGAARPNDAGVVLAQAIARKPNQGDLMREYGKLLLRNGFVDQAAGSLEQAKKHGADSWDTFSALGVAYDTLGQPAKARASYEAALALNPNSTAVLTNYGLHLGMNKDLKQAETYLRRAALQPDASSKTRANLALIIGLQGRYDEAEKILLRDLTPTQAQENMSYIKELMRSKNSWDAIKSARG